MSIVEEVDMAQVVSQLHVRVVNRPTTRLRSWLGIRILALGALVMGMGEVEIVGTDDQ